MRHALLNAHNRLLCLTYTYTSNEACASSHPTRHAVVYEACGWRHADAVGGMHAAGGGATRHAHALGGVGTRHAVGGVGMREVLV
jgi:hypothetical protein